MATFYASKTGEVSAREKEHSALVRELAGECMTLLGDTFEFVRIQEFVSPRAKRNAHERFRLLEKKCFLKRVNGPFSRYLCLQLP